jgi:hypothetical protein
MDIRLTRDGRLDPDGRTAKPHLGELVIGGGTAFASASNPSAEVIDGTGVSAGRSNGVTLTTSAGTIEIDRAGDYCVELALSDFSCGAASGNVEFNVFYAPDGTTFAAFGATEATGGGGRMSAIRLALTTKESIGISKIQHLKKGSKIRAIVTSAAGNAITCTEGSLSATQLSDATVATPD